MTYSLNLSLKWNNVSRFLGYARNDNVNALKDWTGSVMTDKSGMTES